MSRFFVGQRVRIVGVTRYSQFLGRECRVVSIGKIVERRFSIELDVWPEDEPWCRFVLPEHLEPILDSNQPCDAEFKESLDKLLDPLTRPCKGEV